MLDAVAEPRVTARTRTCDEPRRVAQPCRSIPWACVYTHPQAERWAETGLRRQGYETYLPLTTVLSRDRVIRSLRHRVEVPAFSRYLFIRFDASRSSWSPIRATPGVVDLVRCGHNVGYASETAVSELQAALAQPATQERWEPGTPCAMLSGPFAGLSAVVLDSSGDNATIAVLFLGELRRVSVAADCLSRRD